MLNFDPTAVLLDCVVGGVGLALFLYGRKEQRIPQLVTGLLLMVYPYFAATTVQMIVVGGVIGLGFWGALWLGW